MAIASAAQPVLTRGRAPITVESVLEPRDVRTWFAVLLGSVGGTVDEQTMALATTVFSHLANDPASGWHLYLAHMSHGARGLGQR